jgi:hypothetical protein
LKKKNKVKPPARLPGSPAARLSAASPGARHPGGCEGSAPFGQINIGNKTENLDSLIGSYYNFCKLNNIETIKKYRFSEILIDKLKSLKWENISKKRTGAGLFITGISYKKKNNLTEKTNSVITNGLIYLNSPEKGKGLLRLEDSIPLLRLRTPTLPSLPAGLPGARHCAARLPGWS